MWLARLFRRQPDILVRKYSVVPEVVDDDLRYSLMRRIALVLDPPRRHLPSLQVRDGDDGQPDRQHPKA